MIAILLPTAGIEPAKSDIAYHSFSLGLAVPLVRAEGDYEEHRPFNCTTDDWEDATAGSFSSSFTRAAALSRGSLKNGVSRQASFLELGVDGNHNELWHSRPGCIDAQVDTDAGHQHLPPCSMDFFPPQRTTDALDLDKGDISILHTGCRWLP